MIIESMLSSGQIMKHVEEILIPTLRKRYHSMVRAIHDILHPLGVQILQDNGNSMRDDTLQSSPAGGYFLYITFPEQDKFAGISDIVNRAAEEHSLQLAPGHIYQVGSPTANSKSKEVFRQGLRLCWAWHEEENIIEGMQRLSEVLKATKSEAN
jgi:DNA-binding transcriptional MocR family regulator